MPTPEDWAKGEVLNMKEAKRLTTGIYKGQVEHKYDYVATQFDTPAYGWSSTKEHVGLWLITPSNEYMSGGPTKIELNAHLDGNETGWPTLLNVWKGPHYGATQLFAVPGESWTKCIGPFLLYCNSAPSHEQMWKDALDRAATDAKAWPFDWVNDPSFYPPKAARSTVTGQIVLNDPYVKQSQISNLLVGLSAPDWKAPGNRNIDWQQDSKFYQFWVRADSSGKFAIPNVRAGDYVLHAFSTGVLGELSRADIKVVEGKPLDLGQLAWTPVRFGKPIWEIGIPDRSAGEFFRGDDYWHWGLYTLYPKDFPNDVNFVIGKSDWRKDWNLMQVPRGTDPDGKGQGTATTWTIRFDMPQAPRGKATLRLALAGTEARSVAITMNDKPAGNLTGLPNTMVIHRDSNRSYWTEKPVSFDATLMKAGENVLKLTIPAGSLTAGIEYDYLRLELDESSAAN
jgi:rhamnogalacturonan endolyase